MRKVSFFGLLLIAFTISTTVLSQSDITAFSVPTFTGSAPDDFTSDTVQYVSDLDGVNDVGTPPNFPPDAQTGWELVGIYFEYDHATDTMYIGIDCDVICGDADADGNPGGTSPGLAVNEGNDRPDMDGTESISMILDLDMDYPNASMLPTLGFDVVVGVNGVGANDDINSFGAYNFDGNPFAPFAGYGDQLPNTVNLFANPSASQPDIEFSIANFSTLPGANFQPGESFMFQVNAYAGSAEDDGFGEDYISGEGGVTVIQIPPPASLGDYVWEDLNLDGIQDEGEPGIPDVPVSLHNGSGDFLATMPTDGTGIYNYYNLDPGDYYVVFGQPEGYILTLQDQGDDDAVDSDAEPGTLATHITNLEPGEHDPTLDAGFYRLACIGDYVWEDLNKDGIQDENEPPVPGVTVNLTGEDNIGNIIEQSMQTDEDGIYLFCELVPGTYAVQFELPEGFEFTLQDQGENDAVDSDADVETGQAIETFLESGEVDRTWDAGLVRLPPTPTPTNTPTNTPTATFTPTNTPTVTPTSTPTDTPTATFTPTDTPTATYTPLPSATPTDTPTPTPDIVEAVVVKTGHIIPKTRTSDGEVLEWVITIENDPTDVSENVMITNTFGPEFTLDSVFITKGTFEVEGQTITVNVGNLDLSEVFELKVLTTVKTESSEVSNTVCVTADNWSEQNCNTAIVAID